MKKFIAMLGGASLALWLLVAAPTITAFSGATDPVWAQTTTETTGTTTNTDTEGANTATEATTTTEADDDVPGIPGDQTDTEITIPYGDMLASLASILLALSGVVLAWLMRKLPGSIVNIIKTAQLDQLLEKAIGFGINTTVGATKGKTLNVDVGNKVLANAVEYALKHGSSAAIDWANGENGIREKIVARLQTPTTAAMNPDVTVATTKV